MKKLYHQLSTKAIAATATKTSVSPPDLLALERPAKDAIGEFSPEAIASRICGWSIEHLHRNL